MKALITGGTGFVGKHLIEELAGSYDVNAVGVEDFSLTDYEAIHNYLRKFRPDVIFHLGAIAFVPTSWNDPRLVFDVNLKGSLNLFEAVRSVGIDPVIQIAGSSEEYGLVYPDEVPINENNPLRPLSPYAVSKIAMDFLGYQYFKSYGLKVIRTRAFNHEGYGRGEQYMPSTFAKQIVEVERGKRVTIKHGDLTSKRDITDVRDMVRAYRLAVELGEPGEAYNIGSGKVYSAQEVLDTLIKISGVNPKLEVDPKRMRPSDVKILHCDNTKFVEKTQWQPKHALEDTLGECLRYWRERI